MVRQERKWMSRIKNKIIFIIILIVINNYLFGQTGFISIPDSGKWHITIDDTLHSLSSQTLIPVTAGKHSLIIQPVNNKNWKATAQYQEIFIQEADTFRVMPAIPKFKSSYLQVDESNQNNTNIVLNTSNQKFNRRKYYKPVILAMAVAANWASFYIKRKADDYYDIYSETSNLNKMEKYYNRAADYDIYANIMLGVSGVALTAYFYYLMTD